MTHFYEVKRKTRDSMMETESAREVNISDFTSITVITLSL